MPKYTHISRRKRKIIGLGKFRSQCRMQGRTRSTCGDSGARTKANPGTQLCLQRGMASCEVGNLWPREQQGKWDILDFRERETGSLVWVS